MIHAQRSSEVFETLDALLDQLGAEGPYRALFDRALAEARRAGEAGCIFLPADVPLTVAEVLGCPAREARVAAAACTLLWAGADLMDDAADGDLPPVWRGTPSSRIGLVAANLLATLPHLVAAELDGDLRERGMRLARFGELVSRTLFEMSQGQFADLESARCVHSREDYARLLRLKTGSEIGLFAAAPALLAGQDACAVERWHSFGVAYGCMAQLFTDVASTFAEPPEGDLLRGKRTLPVLYALERLSGDERTAFRRDLETASTGNHGAARRAIRSMLELRAARFSLSRVELLRRRAVERLPVRLAKLPVDHGLHAVVRGFSVI
jgi:geranylgeranyl pyrophosphate synthase